MKPLLILSLLLTACVTPSQEALLEAYRPAQPAAATKPEAEPENPIGVHFPGRPTNNSIWICQLEDKDGKMDLYCVDYRKFMQKKAKEQASN